MLAMALWLVPGGLAMLAIAPLSARLSARHGAKTTLGVGGVVIAAGFASAIWLMGTTWGLMVAVMACNIGIGMAYAAIPLIIMDAVPVTETASANGFNTLCRAIGTSTAGAVIGELLATSTTQADGYSIPTLAGLQVVLLIGCGASLLAALLAVALPKRSTLLPAAPARSREAGSAGVPGTSTAGPRSPQSTSAEAERLQGVVRATADAVASRSSWTTKREA